MFGGTNSTLEDAFPNYRWKLF